MTVAMSTSEDEGETPCSDPKRLCARTQRRRLDSEPRGLAGVR